MTDQQQIIAISAFLGPVVSFLIRAAYSYLKGPPDDTQKTE